MGKGKPTRVRVTLCIAEVKDGTDHKLHAGFFMEEPRHTEYGSHFRISNTWDRERGLLIPSMSIDTSQRELLKYEKFDVSFLYNKSVVDMLEEQ